MTSPGPRRCAARNRRGEPCGAQPLLGSDKCRHHAGRKREVIRAEYEVQRRAARIFNDHYPGIDPDDDNALTDLLRIKNDALGWLEICRSMLGELAEIRYKSRSSGEQLRAEVSLWERALDRCARICADLVRLGIEEKIVAVQGRIDQNRAATLHTVLTATLHELGHDTSDVRAALGRHLKLVNPDTDTYQPDNNTSTENDTAASA